MKDRRAAVDGQGISFDVDQPLPFGEAVGVAEAGPDCPTLHSFRERGWAKWPAVDQDEVLDVPVRWVDLPQPIIVRAGEAFIAVPEHESALPLWKPPEGSPLQRNPGKLGKSAEAVPRPLVVL